MTAAAHQPSLMLLSGGVMVTELDILLVAHPTLRSSGGVAQDQSHRHGGMLRGRLDCHRLPTWMRTRQSSALIDEVRPRRPNATSLERARRAPPSLASGSDEESAL